MKVILTILVAVGNQGITISILVQAVDTHCDKRG